MYFFSISDKILTTHGYKGPRTKQSSSEILVSTSYYDWLQTEMRTLWPVCIVLAQNGPWLWTFICIAEVNSTCVDSRSMKWPLVPAVFALLWSHSPRIEDSTALLLVPYPDQGREQEGIIFPFTPGPKKTCIEAVQLPKKLRNGGAALDRRNSLFLGESQEWWSKAKWRASVVSPVLTFSSHRSLTGMAFACLHNMPT